MARTPAGQSKPDSKPNGGVKGQQNESAGGSEFREAAARHSAGQGCLGGNPPNSEKKQPGGKGPGDESQLAQNVSKLEQKTRTAAAGPSTQGMPGDKKSGKNPKNESSNSLGWRSRFAAIEEGRKAGRRRTIRWR